MKYLIMSTEAEVHQARQRRAAQSAAEVGAFVISSYPRCLPMYVMLAVVLFCACTMLEVMTGQADFGTVLPSCGLIVRFGLIWMLIQAAMHLADLCYEAGDLPAFQEKIFFRADSQESIEG